MAPSIPIVTNAFKIVPNLKFYDMVSLYNSQALHPYMVHNFLNYISAPNILYTICSLNRHYIVSNPNTNKTFLKLKTNSVVSF